MKRRFASRGDAGIAKIFSLVPGVFVLGFVMDCAVILSVDAAEPGNRPTRPDSRRATGPARLRYDGRDFEQWVEEFLNELNPAKRIQALPALVKFGRRGRGREAAEAIADALTDDDSPELTEAAIAHLTKLGRAAVPVLIDKLKDESNHVRIAAAKALREIGPPAASAVPVLLAVAGECLSATPIGADIKVAILADEAFEALLHIAVPPSQAVYDGLHDRVPGVRAVCVRLIGRAGRIAGTSSPIDELSALLDDPYRVVRTSAAVALWRLAPNSKEVVERLTAALRKDAEDFGDELTAAFYETEASMSNENLHVNRGERLDRHTHEHSEAAIELLAAAMDWPEFDRLNGDVAWSWRFRVLRLLSEFGPRAMPAVRALVQLSRSGEARLRGEAIDTLGAIGPKAAEAVETLESLASDETSIEFPRGAGPYSPRNGEEEPAPDTIGAHARAALARIRGAAMPGIGPISPPP